MSVPWRKIAYLTSLSLSLFLGCNVKVKYLIDLAVSQCVYAHSRVVPHFTHSQHCSSASRESFHEDQNTRGHGGCKPELHRARRILRRNFRMSRYPPVHPPCRWLAGETFVNRAERKLLSRLRGWILMIHQQQENIGDNWRINLWKDLKSQFALW